MAHPSPCPPWCRHRSQPLDHDYGPAVTAHWSPEYQLAGPRPEPKGLPILMRAELSRLDEASDTDEVVLYVQGETSVDLKATEADVFIAQAQAWVDTLRVLRRQMA